MLFHRIVNTLRLFLDGVDVHQPVTDILESIKDSKCITCIAIVAGDTNVAFADSFTEAVTTVKNYVHEQSDPDNKFTTVLKNGIISHNVGGNKVSGTELYPDFNYVGSVQAKERTAEMELRCLLRELRTNPALQSVPSVYVDRVMIPVRKGFNT